MGFIEKACDSRGCVTHGGGVRVSDAGHRCIKRTKVSDASYDVAVYKDLVAALSSNGIKHLLIDYRIWSEDIFVDKFDDRYRLVLYADGFVEDEGRDYDHYDAFYSERGEKAFYALTILRNWGIQIHRDNDLVVEFYGTDPNMGQVKSLADLLGYISEADLSYETAVDVIKKALSDAGITYSSYTEGDLDANAKPVMDFIEKVCGSQGCAESEKVSDSRSVEYRVMLSDCKDSEGVPISVSILVDSDDVEVFEDYLRREEGNSYGHAFGGSVEY